MNIKYNKALWLIIILAIVMMTPFLGLSDFNTKGEPREAVVAWNMATGYCPSTMVATSLTNHHSFTGASHSSASSPAT